MTPRQFKVVGIIDKLKFASYVVFSIKNNGHITFAKAICKGQNGVIAYPPTFEISELAFKIKMPFAYFAGIVIHEMIHQFNVEHNDELQIRENMLNKEKQYD